MYIRFDINQQDPELIAFWVHEWANNRDIAYTKKLIWNRRRQEFRVSFLEQNAYTLFAITWPEHYANFDIVGG